MRIAMTVARSRGARGPLLRAEREEPGEGEGAAKVEFSERRGLIHPDLTIGPNTAAVDPSSSQ